MKINASRERLKKYGRVIALWLAKFDTFEIAAEVDLPECLVAAWVPNFRDMTAKAAA